MDKKNIKFILNAETVEIKKSKYEDKIVLIIKNPKIQDFIDFIILNKESIKNNQGIFFINK